MMAGSTAQAEGSMLAATPALTLLVTYWPPTMPGRIVSPAKDPDCDPSLSAPITGSEPFAERPLAVPGRQPP
jgi:hypothetical protein